MIRVRRIFRIRTYITLVETLRYVIFLVLRLPPLPMDVPICADYSDLSRLLVLQINMTDAEKYTHVRVIRVSRTHGTSCRNSLSSGKRISKCPVVPSSL